MREELGYDMTNEVFIHPKDLDEKHQEMVKEQNARKDEMTIKKKNKEFANIAKRYESLCKRYQAAADGYIILLGTRCRRDHHGRKNLTSLCWWR